MAEWEVRELTSAFGAEIRGLDAHAPLDDHSCDALRDVFDDRGLLLFRGLDIDADEQAYLTRRLVGIEGAPGDVIDEEHELPDAHFVSNREPGGHAPYGRLLFHSDLMSSPSPCLALSLYAVELDAPVAPTIFASATHAWDTLPEELRARVRDTSAVHGYERVYPDRDNEDGEVLRPIFERPQMTTTPVARRHPHTGRTILYVSQQKTSHIVGLVPDESEALLEGLFAHLYEPANLYHHDWQIGDLVIWDNLAVQHARSNVLADGPVRTLRKVISSISSAPGTRETPRFEPAS